MLSATRSRWGQRLGQEKAVSENSNLRKAKVLEIRRSVSIKKSLKSIENTNFIDRRQK